MPRSASGARAGTSLRINIAVIECLVLDPMIRSVIQSRLGSLGKRSGCSVPSSMGRNTRRRIGFNQPLQCVFRNVGAARHFGDAGTARPSCGLLSTIREGTVRCHRNFCPVFRVEAISQ
jgi:hypothetical protein